MTTNDITKAQQILDLIHSELRSVDELSNIGGTLTERAAAHTVRGGRLHEIALFQKLADELGDIDSDAADDDSWSILEATREHLTAALSTVNYGAGHRPPTVPLNPEDYVAVGRYVEALQEWNAARRFAALVTGILDPQVAA